jgi:D-amino peptidase
MKVYIHTDIEGVAGWVFYASTSTSEANRAHTQRMNALLTAEVAAAARAALDAGADGVWINDMHGHCYSIIFEDLPRGCQIIQGRAGFFDAWLPCFDDSVDALVCIGQHAMAGAPHAVCPHSLWHVNDRWQLSETTMAAALAACHGVPCVAVSGDDKLCAEVTDKIPAIASAAVKWGIAAQNARSMVPADAQDAIYKAVTDGLGRRSEIPPFDLPGPYRLNISDRDPTVRILPTDICGDDLWETVHRALNSTDYCHFGDDPIDDRSFRWPD